MRKLLLITFIFLASCTTRPNPNPPPDEINVFAENVDRVAESTEAVESVLVCGTWTGRQLAQAAVNLVKVLPFFSDTEDPCTE